MSGAQLRAVSLLNSRGLARAMQARQLHATGPARKEEEPLPPSIVEKYNLTDPTRYVPLTIGGFGLASATGLYHFDAESQLLALWVLFCGTVYTRGGPIIAEALDEMAQSIQKEHSAVEKAEIEAVKVTIEAHKRQTAVYQDIKELFDAQNTVLDGLVGSAQSRLRHGVRTAFVKKLDTIVAAENKVSEETRKVLIEKATASVKSAYLTSKDSTLKNNALDAALAALANPEGAKKDPTVGQLYSKYLADFQSTLKASASKSFDLTPEEISELKESAENVARREGIDLASVSIPNKASIQA